MWFGGCRAHCVGLPGPELRERAERKEVRLGDRKTLGKDDITFALEGKET